MKKVCLICKNGIIEPNYISRIILNGFICRQCYNPTIATGILTRVSSRVVSEQNHYKADLLPPHTYSKESKKMIINPDFVKLYPNTLNYYESEQSVKKAGYPKLSEKMKDDKIKREKIKEAQANVSFEGSQEARMKNVIQ